MYILNYAKKNIFLLLILILNTKFLISQPNNSKPLKNPVKAMFFQRYFHLSSIGYSLNFFFTNKIFKIYKNYNPSSKKKGGNLLSAMILIHLTK